MGKQVVEFCVRVFGVLDDEHVALAVDGLFSSARQMIDVCEKKGTFNGALSTQAQDVATGEVVATLHVFANGGAIEESCTGEGMPFTI